MNAKRSIVAATVLVALVLLVYRSLNVRTSVPADT